MREKAKDLGFIARYLCLCLVISAVDLPRSRRGGWRISNISGGPALLSLAGFVAGEKVAAFLSMPVHGTTFLRFGGFLIRTNENAVNFEL